MRTIKTVFLGWDAPLVHSAAEYLSTHFRGSGGVDLTRALVVAPSRRAGRQVLQRIALQAGSVLGDIVTPQDAVDRLLTIADEHPPATPWQRRIAWTRAADLLTNSERDALWPESVEKSTLQKLAVAAAIDAAAVRLGAEGFTFAEALQAVESRELPDAARWRSLSILESRFQEVLHASLLLDGVRSTLESAQRSQPGSRPNERFLSVVLVGLTEIPGLLRRVLDAGEYGTSVLVAAPPSFQDHFDELGVPNVKWKSTPQGIPEASIEVVDTPREEAEAALVAAARSESPPEDVVVAAPDPSVRAWIERLASWLQPPEDGREPLTVRSIDGRPAGQSAPTRLLSLLSGFLADPTFGPYAALIRHRDFEQALRMRSASLDAGTGASHLTPETDILEALDSYASSHVHGVIDGAWLGDAALPRIAPLHAVLSAVFHAFRSLLAGLFTPGAAPDSRPISVWAGPIVEFVRAVYDQSADDEAVKVSAMIEQAARSLRGGRVFGQNEPHVSAAAAIRLVLGELQAQRLVAPREGGEVEILSWQDAVHDPAPVLILTGMNEGFVPKSSGGDALIPEALKRALGVGTRELLQARDAFLMMHALRSRRMVKFISARHAADGSRLWPSSLLMAEDDQTAVARLGRFLDTHAPDAPRQTPALRGSKAVHPAFELMPVVEQGPVESIPVTAFKTYLQSPYSFYLSHVLKLGEVEDEHDEMPPSVFGTYIHRVLERFARSPACNSPSIERVLKEIERCAAEVTASDAGVVPPTAVAVQVEQALYRLRGFARWQAARAAEGWQIIETEWSTRGAALDVNGTRVLLKGRIDRVDFNPSTRELALLDYKTGSQDASTIRGMYRADRAPYAWNDLQLPLYWYMARDLIRERGASAVSLGYVTLPKDGDVELCLGDWTQEHLDAAIDVAKEVAELMLSGAFRERGRFPPDEGAGAVLCGVSVILAPEGGAP